MMLRRVIEQISAPDPIAGIGRTDACACENKTCELFGKPVSRQENISCPMMKCTLCDLSLVNIEDVGNIYEQRILDKIISKIKEYESIFPMDSYKKKRVLRVPYPNEQAGMKKKRVLVDLDKTLHQYSKGWSDGTVYDPPIAGAREAMNELKERGYEVVIFSVRTGKSNPDWKKQERMVKEWLVKYDIPFDVITSEKLAAEFYIDDRAIRFEGNWDKTLQVIKHLESMIQID
jgi:hypothetical protein